MASNPYGITQVDVPGLLGTHEARKQAGVRDMLLSRQIAQEDEELKAKRASRQREADVDALFTGEKLPEPAAVFRAGGAKAGFDYAKAYGEMRESERKAARSRTDALARVGMSLRRLPYDQRKAALEGQADTIAEMTGLPRDQILNFDPSDASIDGIISQSMEVKDQFDLIDKDRKFALDKDKFGYQQKNDALNRQVQIRGQNMTDARAREGGAGDKPPAGYRWAADGRSFEFIPGGPADPRNRRKETTLPGSAIEKLGAEANTVQQISDLSGAFKDDYSGPGSSLVNSVGRSILGTDAAREQAGWWQRMEAFDNVVRNQLFGASLTAGEQAAWERTTVAPGMSPKTIRQNLSERQRILDSALRRKADAYKAGGYSDEAIDRLTRIDIPQIDYSRESPGSGVRKPVAVQSAADIAKLPRGTPFIIPSGPNKGKTGYAQ